MSASSQASAQKVLVFDFGAQYGQLIARRVRDLHVYSEIVPCDITAEEVREMSPSAIILSGGPASVNAEDAPRVDPAIYELGVPVLGFCYGHQITAVTLGGTVFHPEVGEYGPATLHVEGGALFEGTPAEQTVWMSHFDAVRNVPEGFAPGSDTAIMSIFGCSPRKYFFGRAPLEAAASGIRLAPGDACYRCNMVTYADEDVPFEHKHIISHSAGSIEGRESDELVTMLFDHPDFRPLAEQAGMVIHKGSSFRHLAVQSHVDIKGIQLAPPHDHLGEEIGPILPTGCPNADVLRELMRRAFDILDQHPINVARRAAGKLPANGVWFWAEGTAAALPNFPEHYGSDGGVVSAVPLCHGIGILTGLEAVTVPTATGEWDTDYAAKVAAALGVLKKHDFVALHLEGPDEATHNHDLEHKIYSIERLSADIVAPVTEALRAAGEDFRLLLLSDHMTYMANGAHGADPVPFVLYDSRVSEGSGLPYSEANGRKGPYVDDGAELMDLLFELKKL